MNCVKRIANFFSAYASNQLFICFGKCKQTPRNVMITKFDINSQNINSLDNENISDFKYIFIDIFFGLS
jgi:hypothetical protein